MTKASWAPKAILLLLLSGCQPSERDRLVQARRQLLLEPKGASLSAPQELDSLLAAYVPAELTGTALPAAEQAQPVRLLVFSHAYGSPVRGRSGIPLPSPALINNTAQLRAREPQLVVSVGDFVYKYRPSNLEATIGVLKQLGAPVVNAVGNHDVSDREAYERRLGNTFGILRLNQNLLFILDSELEPWNISEEQIQLLTRCLQLAPAAGIERVLVFAHKLIFAVENERYGPLIGKNNAHDGWAGSCNFKGRVLPLLEAFVSDGRELIWFGGDIGVRWSYGLFYDRDPANGITYVCTGMGVQPWDNALEVLLPAEGKSSFVVLPLAQEPLPKLEDCGPDFWAKRFPRWNKRKLELKSE